MSGLSWVGGSCVPPGLSAAHPSYCECWAELWVELASESLCGMAASVRGQTALDSSLVSKGSIGNRPLHQLTTGHL